VNNYIKIGIAGALGYGAYKLYKIYRLSEEITYTPVGFKYNAGTIEVKMRLDNPVSQSLKMRGIDGKLYTANNVIGTFTSGPFQITEGVSYFTLAFKTNVISLSAELITALIFKTIPTMTMDIVKKTPFISTKETIVLNPQKLD
jgi:hypothetical protein